MADTLSIEQFTEEVAAQIASQLKIDTTALVKSLVDSLSKGLVDRLIINKASAPITQETAKAKDTKQQTQKQEAPSLISKATEQALSKIPMLASALVEVAKKAENNKTEKVFKDICAGLPKGFERYFQSIKDVMSNGFASFKTKQSAESGGLDATKPAKTFLEKEESKEQKVLFDGFTQLGLEQLYQILPEIIKKGVSDVANNIAQRKETKDNKQQTTGQGLFKELKGLAGLAGLAALMFALETDGPFKGIAKIASKGLLQVSGWTKMIDGFVSKFVKNVIGVPLKLIGKFEKSFAGLIGKEVGGEVVKTGIGKLTGFASKFLGGVLKTAKRIPFIGSLISIGMAFSRFKQGDIVGGGLEVLSGIAGLFPGVGTAISLAIDGLNAFLDMKADGTPEGGGKGKGGLLLGWVQDLSNWVYKNFITKIRSFPVIGPLFKAIDAFKDGRWIDGIKQLAYTNPMFDAIGELLGDTETTGLVKTGTENAFKIGDFFSGLNKAFMTKIKQWWKSLSDGFRFLVEAVIPDDLKKELTEAEPTKESKVISNTSTKAATPTTEPAKSAPKPSTTTKTLTETKIKDAEPTINVRTRDYKKDNSATVEPSEANSPIITPEEQAPKIENEQGEALEDKSAKHLSKLVENSEAQTQNIANLVVGFNTLAKALEKLGVSVAENSGGTTTIINGKSTGPVRASTAADYANIGNSSISSFRNFIEQSRQTPA